MKTGSRPGAPEHPEKIPAHDFFDVRRLIAALAK
jgi:hypothetical protein